MLASHRITGELLSVNPYIARKVPSLFALNERAVYYGKLVYNTCPITHLIFYKQVSDIQTI